MTSENSATAVQENDVPHIDLEINPNNLKEEFIPVLQEIRPTWSKRDLHFSESSPLNSDRGLLNTMVTCYHGDDQEDKIMIRIFDSKATDAMWDRRMEVSAVKYLGDRECGPKVLATYRNGFCYKYIQGDVLCRERLMEERIWCAIAEEFAKLHVGCFQDDHLNKSNLVIIDLIKRYARNFPTKLNNPEYDKRFQTEYSSAEVLKNDVDMLLAHVAAIESPIVLCHNDTRAENILWNKEKGAVYFVDFEAVSYNYQALDIAMHFVRFAGLHHPDYSLYPDDHFRTSWLRVYLQKYYQLTGKNSNDVTEYDVQRLFVQVEKCRLLTLLFYAVAGPTWANHFDNIASSQIDIIDLGVRSLKEYFNLKTKILALQLPSKK